MNTTPIFASTIFDKATVRAQEAVVEASKKAQRAAQEAVQGNKMLIGPYTPIEMPKGVGEKLNISVTDANIVPEEVYQTFIIG